MIDITGLREDKRPQSSTIVHALLDRLEAAEKEREMDEERIADLMADLNRVGHENDALRAKVEAAENDAAHQKALAESALRVAEGWERKCAALQAKIEQMERQGPVGTAMLCVQCSTPFDGDYYCPTCGHHTATEETVYALPGAQPAPSVPEVTDAMALAFHHALTDGSIGAREVEEIKDALRAALAAAEAKP